MEDQSGWNSWKKVWSKSQAKYYWYNEDTKESKWERIDQVVNERESTYERRRNYNNYEKNSNAKRNSYDKPRSQRRDDNYRKNEYNSNTKRHKLTQLPEWKTLDGEQR